MNARAFALPFLASTIMIGLYLFAPTTPLGGERHSVYCLEHLMLGVGVASLSMAFYPSRKTSMVLVVLVAVTWEIFQGAWGYAPVDTLLDVVLGILGGLVVAR